MQDFEHLWSDRILLLNRLGHFVPRPNPNTRTVLEVLRSFQENISLDYSEACALGEEMGQLFVRLRITMRLLKILPPWNEYGPRAQGLMDPESRVLIETSLRRLAHIEEAWVWAQQGI